MISDELTAIGAALRSAFPDLLPITPRRILETGFSSTAVETAEGLIFLIARNEVTWARYMRVFPALPVLYNRLPVATPNLKWCAPPSAHFPFGVIGYPKLPGQPFDAACASRADMRQIAGEMARFLTALHTFPRDDAPLPPPPSEADRRAEWEMLRDDTLPALREALTPAEYEKVVRWWEMFIDDAAMHHFAPMLRHGDLWYGNVLVDDTLQHIVGVVDFENLAFDDPAQDFVTQLYLGARFTERVLARYRGMRVDARFVHRIQRLWELREFGGLQYSIRFDDEEEFEDSIYKLRKGPILNPGAARLVL